MAKIKSKKVTIVQSTAEDAVGGRFRILPIDQEYNDDESVPYHEVIIEEPGSTQVYDIASFSNVPKVKGRYNIYFVAIDDGGNESDPIVAEAVFDFQPPTAPISITLQ